LLGYVEIDLDINIAQRLSALKSKVFRILQVLFAAAFPTLFLILHINAHDVPFSDGIYWVFFAEHLWFDKLLLFNAAHQMWYFAPAVLYRLLTPIVVHVISAVSGFGLEFSFKLITWVTSILTALVIYCICRKLRISHLMSMLAASMYTFSFLNIFNLWYLYDLDALGGLLMALGTYALLCRNDIGFSASLLLGVLNKETQLFLIPLYYALQPESRVSRRLMKTILVSLPSLMAMVSLRLINPSGIAFDYLAPLNFFVAFAHSGAFAYLVLYTFGFVWLLFAVSMRRNSLNARLGLLPILLFMGVLFVNDYQRLLAYSFPVVIPLAVMELERLSKDHWEIIAATTLIYVKFNLDLLGVMVQQNTASPLLPTDVASFIYYLILPVLIASLPSLVAKIQNSHAEPLANPLRNH
jgi:hypothetical protein